MPVNTFTGFRWTDTFYGSPSTETVEIRILDNDSTLDWFGDDNNQRVFTDDGRHTADLMNGGSILNVSMDLDGDGIEDVVEPVLFFQVGSPNDWYFIPLPGSQFEVGDTLLGNVGDWVDPGVGYEYEDIVCFTDDTLVLTNDGEVAIGDICEGDLVWTRDNGYQPVRWAGSSSVPASGKLAPIVIKCGTLANTRDLTVSPQHAILLTDWRAEMFFGCQEILVRAIDLLNHDGVSVQEGGQVTYCHLMFDRHELILAEGTYSESLYPGPSTAQALGQEAFEEIHSLFPGVFDNPAQYGPKAARYIRKFEARCIA